MIYIFVLLLVFHSYCNSNIRTNIVSTRKKRQSNRRLLSLLDDFDQDMVISNAAKGTQENIVVNEDTNDRNLTVGTSSNNKVVNEITLNVKTLERCFKERIDREMSILLILLKIAYRM